MEQIDISVLPNDVSRVRSCLLCSIIQTPNQFKSMGCPNCESVLGMRGSLERVMECTSPKFDGMVGHVRASKSWVSKWQRLERFLPGLYAVRVFGRLPEDVEADLEDQGISYEPKE